MDLYEWECIEEYRDGKRDRLLEYWCEQRGKPLSPLLHEFLLERLENKPLRPRGRQKKPGWAAEIRSKLKFAEVKAKLCTKLDPPLPPTSKKAIICEVAEGMGLKFKTVEQHAYPQSKKRKAIPPPKPK